MGTEFTPIFLYVLVAIALATGMIVATSVIGPKKKTTVKLMPYESGMDPIGDARQRFDVRFYLVAIIFLLFDVELLFLYPWAVGQWSVEPRAEAAAAAPADPGAASTADQIAAATTPSIEATATTAGIPPVFRNLVFWAVLLLVVMLTAADAYAWRKGVFSWR